MTQHENTAPHGSRRGYLIGFLLSVVFTAIPFWLVMTGAVANVAVAAALIFGFAIAQIVVHVICFLHLDTRGEGGWTLISFVFTVVIVTIVLGGSLWIMFHLNTNMMPMQPGAADGAM